MPDGTMIMSRIGINHAYDVIDGLNTQCNNLSEDVTDISNTIKSNESFNLFSHGTTFGSNLSERWERALNQYDYYLRQIDSLMSSSRAFLEEQERLNNSTI